jgi:polysaccharide export outer membrane protein
VRPDGFITLPLVDDVKASGLSFPELDRALTESLAKHIQTPDVAVIATTVRPATVYVLGEVNTQGPVTLRDASTAVQAIAHAGGFKTSAKTESIVVIRLVEDRITAIKVNYDLTGQPGPLMALHNVVLAPDDIVFVPKSYIAQIGDWLNDYINRPLTGVTGIVGLYTNYKLIEALDNE